MGRIADILVRVRDSLGDELKTRWSDDRLLRLIDEAQKKVAKKAKVLRAKTPILIFGDQALYTLPDNAYLLSRVVCQDGCELPMFSHDQMDEKDPCWETVTGSTIEAIVYDKQNPRIFKVYPIPLQTDGGETFIVDDFGLVTFVDGDVIVPDFGVVVDLTTSATKETIFNSVYGIVTGMSSTEATLIAYYSYLPPEINAIDIAPSELVIEDMYDIAIKHYVVGIALRDDQDTQNRQVGNEELILFGDELGEAKRDSSKQFKSKQAARTTYNGIG